MEGLGLESVNTDIASIKQAVDKAYAINEIEYKEIIEGD